MDVEIQIIKSKSVADLYDLISVFQNVFEMEKFTPPSKKYLQNLLHKETFFAVVAKVERTTIGGLSVYVLDQYYSEKPVAYIHDLAVLTEYQRKGVGKKLIEFTINYCRENGFEEVFVQAEKVDDYAVDFYRKTKPTVELQAVHFSYKL